MLRLHCNADKRNLGAKAYTKAKPGLLVKGGGERGISLNPTSKARHFERLCNRTGRGQSIRAPSPRQSFRAGNALVAALKPWDVVWDNKIKRLF
jgi:hypothetical protein